MLEETPGFRSVIADRISIRVGFPPVASYRAHAAVDRQWVWSQQETADFYCTNERLQKTVWALNNWQSCYNVQMNKHGMTYVQYVHHVGNYNYQKSSYWKKYFEEWLAGKERDVYRFNYIASSLCNLRPIVENAHPTSARLWQNSRQNIKEMASAADISRYNYYRIMKRQCNYSCQ